MILADSNISGVPADFVKYFMMMLIGLGGLWLGYRKGQTSKGTRDDPMHIDQPLKITKKPVYAHKEEVDALRDALAVALDKGNERRVEIISTIHAAERRTIGEMKDLHQRLNPIAEGFQSHAAMLKQIDARITSAENARQREPVGRSQA